MTYMELRLLEELEKAPHGRRSYDLLDYDKIQEIAGWLIERGYIKQRRFGFREGLQILPAGREYLAGLF